MEKNEAQLSPVFLESISGEKKKTEEKAEKIINLMWEAGFPVKKFKN